jgi:ubiquitin-hydrolase Zn-finger-containing protein
MSDECTHTGAIRDVTPSALGCEEYLKIGSPRVHLRLCRICGHVGCCDDSPNRHATKHFHNTRHPIIEGYDPTQASPLSHRQSVQVAGEADEPSAHEGRNNQQNCGCHSNSASASTISYPPTNFATGELARTA